MTPTPESLWPTPLEERLLKAALLSGPQALMAWTEWIAEADIDHLEPASFRLLPLLYHNLKALGVEHPLMGRFKGIYRREWYLNQLLFNEAAQVIKLLAGQGFPSLVLKGAAWATLYYRDPGLRPMEDFDLLVPSYQALVAIKRLQTAGWGPKETPHIPFSPALLNITHARALSGPNGHSIDLHWHVLHTDLEREADADFWETAQLFTLNDIETVTLNHTDHFLHICSLGVEWADTRPIRWVADAVRLLHTVPELDWDRFCARAEQHHLSLQIQSALAYLTRAFDLPIPDSVVARIRALTATATDRRIFEASLVPPELRPVGYKIWYLARSYARLKQYDGWPQKVWGAPGFLRDIWGVPGLWRVPGYAVQTSLARLRRIAQSRAV
jgi:Uncharacterised nucleotidyltransferase